MIVFPAIDLRQGRCVRLSQGRYEAETRYSEAPLAVAQGFAQEGAEWLHIVDLDGAKDPAARQVELVADLVRDSGLKVQTGGGIRTRAQVAELLAAGAERVIVGSLAVKQPAEVAAWLEAFGPERIVLALDVNLDAQGEAWVAVAGWQEAGGMRLNELIALFRPLGLKHVLCTDIARDGLLQGPNLGLYERLRSDYPELALIASGGVASLADLRAAQALGAAGAITGKALYEGRFRLSEALDAVQEAS